MQTDGLPAISVVIPFYNGANYIEKTMISLLNQTFLSFEIICVNDGSTDKSLEILNRFERKDPRVKVFSKQNGGNATKAIIYGVERAVGKYFMYASQDDLFSTDLLEVNYQRAEACKADAVIPDMEYYWEVARPPVAHKGIYGVNGDRTKILTGREAFLLSLDWTIHGFVLWNMCIVKRIGFFDYGLSSDEFSTRMFFFNCEKVVFSSGVFYFRQDNPQAITQKWSINHLGFIETYVRLEHFLIANSFELVEIRKIHRKIMEELVRIRVLYLNNKNEFSFGECKTFSDKIKNVYRENKVRMLASDASGLKQKIKRIFAVMSFTTFDIWCKYIVLRLKLKKLIKEDHG